MPKTWVCGTCGKEHTGLPEGYAFDAPWPWHTTPAPERNQHCKLTEDYCILFDKDFIIRACLEIPIVGQSEPFIWGVWVSLSRQNFQWYRDHFEDSKRAEHVPVFGWLCSRIPIYPDTALLKTYAQFRPVPIRPFVELEPTEHPLAIEQRTGIDEHRLMQIGELLEHNWLHPLWDSNGLYGGAH